MTTYKNHDELPCFRGQLEAA